MIIANVFLHGNCNAVKIIKSHSLEVLGRLRVGQQLLAESGDLQSKVTLSNDTPSVTNLMVVNRQRLPMHNFADVIFCEPQIMKLG